MTAFTGASSATAASAAGPALPALSYTWDGAATPTLTATVAAAPAVTVSGQAMAGYAGVPGPLLAAAQAAGKGSYSVTET